MHRWRARSCICKGDPHALTKGSSHSHPAGSSPSSPSRLACSCHEKGISHGVQNVLKLGVKDLGQCAQSGAGGREALVRRVSRCPGKRRQDGGKAAQRLLCTEALQTHRHSRDRRKRGRRTRGLVLPTALPANTSRFLGKSGGRREPMRERPGRVFLTRFYQGCQQATGL